MKFKRFIIPFLCSALVLTGCSSKETLTDASIELPKELLHVGDTVQLSPIFTFSEETDESAYLESDIWSSSDETVLTVSTDGLIECLSPGIATVSYSVSGISTEAELKVYDKLLYVKVDAALPCYNLKDLPVKIEPVPATATLEDAKFSIKDETIATFDLETMTLKYVSDGETELIITLPDGSEVVSVVSSLAFPSDFTVSPSTISTEVGKSFSGSFEFDVTYEYSSTWEFFAFNFDDEFLSYNQKNGKFTALKAGETIISFSSDPFNTVVREVKVTIAEPGSSQPTATQKPTSTTTPIEKPEVVVTPEPTKTPHISETTPPVVSSPEVTPEPIKTPEPTPVPTPTPVPPCSYCGASAHQTAGHPVCSQCGSTEHTQHPAEKVLNNDGPAVLDALNAFRAEAGLPSLSWDNGLVELANRRAYEIVDNFSHVGVSSQVECIQRIGSSPDVSRAANNWKNSSDHWNSISSTKYTNAAVASVSYNGSTYYVFVGGFTF